MKNIRIDGDKSIAHRALMLASLMPGVSEIFNVPHCSDVSTTIACLSDLGAKIVQSNKSVSVVGGDFVNDVSIDVGESGTTARLIIGLLAGRGIRAKVYCSGSLLSRPMNRIIDPLSKMGAIIDSNNGRIPITIKSGISRGGSFSPRIASAQVKSSLSLASLSSGHDVEIIEKSPTRDHLERMLYLLDPNAININKNKINIYGSQFKCKRFSISIPGDTSSATFIILASILCDRPIKVKGVLLNKRRVGFINKLIKVGASISFENQRILYGERYGDIIVYKSSIESIYIDRNEIPELIDEIPALAVLAAKKKKKIVVRGASELRVKESDRIKSIVENMKSFGVGVIEYSDGFKIEKNKLYNASIKTFSDHRIAMAFYILSKSLGSLPGLDNEKCINKSYPRFIEDINRVIND